MATTITIDGGSVTPGRSATPRRLTVPTGGVGSFTFEVWGGTLPTGAYPYLGKDVTVTIDGTLRFTGDVERCDVEWRDGIGWVRVYTCLPLRNRGDWIGHVDSNNGTPSSTYNAQSDNDPTEYLASRAGLEVGEILTDILTMQDNADSLDALGLGSYTSLSPPTLPSATTTDLAAMDRVIPGPIRFGGEKFLAAVESFLSAYAPNHRLRVEADGTIRFVDMLSLASVTVDLEVDPIDRPNLSRDLTECFTAVKVTGSPVAIAAPFSLSAGTLDEDEFTYDGLTIAQAKAAFRPSHFWNPDCVDQGTCNNTTTTATVTSYDATRTWATDFWNQQSGSRYGTIHLYYDVGTSISMFDQRLIVDSTSLSAAGTSTITFDRAVSQTNFNRYYIRGRRGDKQDVYVVYGLPSWAGEKVAPQTSYPYPFRLASGGGVTMTTSAIGSVLWSSSGSGPYYEVSSPIEVDPDAGVIVFPKPTYMLAGDREPTDVVAWVPLYTDVNEVRKPTSSYEGIGYSVDGIERELTVHVPAWRDPANATAMGDYAQDILDAINDPIIEGSVAYHGYLEDAFDVGKKLVIDSTGYTNPWESEGIPIVEATLDWEVSPARPAQRRTTLRISTRRAHYTESAYLLPERTGSTLDLGFGNGVVDFSFMSGNASTVTNAALGQLLNLHNDRLASDAAASRQALATVGEGAQGAFQGAFEGAQGAFQGAFEGASNANDAAATEADRLLREGQ